MMSADTASTATIISGVAGIPVELPIGRGPATGFVWELTLPAGVEQLPDGPPLPPEDPPLVGSDRSGRFRVSAPAGDYVIDAVNARPWEPENIAETRVFVLRVSAP